MNRLIAIIIAASTLFGCQAIKNKPEALHQERLFPLGVYQHEVEIITKNGESFKMLGVLRMKKNIILLAGLSEIGPTVFRVSENIPNNAVEIEIFDESLRRNESSVRDIYRLFSPLFKMSIPDRSEFFVWLEKNKAGKPLKLAPEFDVKETIIQLSDYRKNGFPHSIELKSPHFQSQIKVKTYAP